MQMKKVLSILLVAVMLLSVIPFTASASTASYKKVTENLSDWSGDYLIVCEDTNKAFNGATSEVDSKDDNKIDVTISNGAIESNATTDAAKVTIEKDGDDYYILTANGDYIGGKSGQNKVIKSDSGIANSITYSDGDVTIISNGCYLRYNKNSGANMFRYYKSDSQTPIQLYKFEAASAPATYTVTWKNYDNTELEVDTGVASGTTPSYDGAAPAKAEDAQNTYTFAGWSDGQTTYGLTDTLPAVTADVTYTATFTATPKPVEPTSTVSFTKVTDASQITAENIGTCTAEEATAWVQENWDAIYSNESLAYYAYYTETTGFNIGIIFPGVSKDYISNYIYTNRDDRDDIEGLTYSLGRGEAVYLCTPTAPAPAATAYAGYLPAEADDADALAAKVVKFNGHDWYLIEDNSTSEIEGTVTLLAADTSFGTKSFDNENLSNKYSTSQVKAYLDDMTETGGAFADVADAIETVTVTTENDTDVTAKLYLLSKSEAGALPANVLMSDNFANADYSGSVYWLRSPHPSSGMDAAYVKCPDGIIYNGLQVYYTFGVRPALQLDLSKVEFDSSSKTFAPAPEDNNNGANLTLEGIIEENIYIDADAYNLGDDAVIKVTYNASTNISETAQEVTDVYNVKDLTPFDDPKDEFDGTYKFAFKQAPAQITEDVVVALYADENAQEPVKTITYSTKDYCDNVIATSNNAKLVALCKSILNYGAAAQTAFNYNTENMAVDEFYNADQIAALTSNDIENPVFTSEAPIKGGSFVCLSTTDMNLYVGDHAVASTGASIADDADSAVKAVTKTRGMSKYINVSGIEADNLLKTVTVTTTVGDIQINSQFMVKTILTHSNDANQITLAKTIYFYAQAANEYFN